MKNLNLVCFIEHVTEMHIFIWFMEITRKYSKSHYTFQHKQHAITSLVCTANVWPYFNLFVDCLLTRWDKQIIFNIDGYKQNMRRAPEVYKHFHNNNGSHDYFNVIRAAWWSHSETKPANGAHWKFCHLHLGFSAVQKGKGLLFWFNCRLLL